MKRRILCALTALLLIAVPALAESKSTSAPNTPSPAGTKFSKDGVSLTLPAGLEILEGDALEAYDAAAQADYPDTARTILAAVDPDGAAVVLFEAESEVEALEAASDAANALISDPDAAGEVEFGRNKAAAFACAIGEQTYRLYFFSDGERLLIAGISGLEQDEIDEMLTGLKF